MVYNFFGSPSTLISHSDVGKTQVGKLIRIRSMVPPVSATLLYLVGRTPSISTNRLCPRSLSTLPPLPRSVARGSGGEAASTEASAFEPPEDEGQVPGRFLVEVRSQEGHDIAFLVAVPFPCRERELGVPDGLGTDLDMGDVEV